MLRPLFLGSFKRGERPVGGFSGLCMSPVVAGDYSWTRVAGPAGVRLGLSLVVV